MADFVRFVFSVGGLCCALLAGLAWALARRRSRAPQRYIVAVILGYTLVSIQPVAHGAARLLARKYRPLTADDVPPGRNAIVLLGSGSFTAHDWDENTLSVSDAVGADRVIEAARVYGLIHPDVIISSGGAVGGMDRVGPGGKVMKDLLVQLGIPEARILVETDSKTTHDEAVIVKRMLAPLAIDHIVLVTSDVHMWRSIGAFRAYGMEVIPAIARSPHFQPPWNIPFLPSPGGLNEAQDVAHEVGGAIYYALRGWYR